MSVYVSWHSYGINLSSITENPIEEQSLFILNLLSTLTMAHLQELVITYQGKLFIFTENDYWGKNITHDTVADRLNPDHWEKCILSKKCKWSHSPEKNFSAI